MSHRAVFDTNVIVSGLGWTGPPAALIDAATRGDIQLVTSTPLLAELRRVLAYPRLMPVVERTGLSPAELADLVERASVLVEPTRTIATARDASDNRVLEAALAGEVEMIVTGDDDLLSLSPFKAIAIVTPSGALARVRGSS